MKELKLILILFIFNSTFLCSQNKKHASNINKILVPLSKASKLKDSTLFHSNYNRLVSLAKKSNDQYLYACLLDKKGVYLYYLGLYKEAITYYDSAINIAVLNSFDSSLIGFYMNRGAINYSAQNFTEALKNYKQSESLMLKIKSPNIGGLLANISLLYREIGDIPNAKSYLNRSIPFIKAAKDTLGYAIALNNLGLIYKDEKNHKSADSIYKLGYEYTKRYKLDKYFSDVTFNLIINLLNLRQFTEAIGYELELLEHLKKYNDPAFEKLLLQTIAKTYMDLDKMKEAMKYIELFEKIGVTDETIDKDEQVMLLNAAEIYFKLNDYKKAAKTYKKYYDMNDANSSSSDLYNVNQLTHSYEKIQDSIRNAKELEIAQLELTHSQETSEYKLQLQRILLLSSLVVLIGIIVFALLLYKSNKLKEKTNIEISIQKKLLSEKNNEITDSIRYAKNIQTSLLPSNHILKKTLNDYFLLYLP
jgi:tetratricopeptide (TPR) repeat protein